MAQRSMTATHIWVTTKGKPKEHHDLDSLPEGKDLLIWFGTFIAGVANRDPARLVSDSTETYINVAHLGLRGRTLDITTTVGRYGEDGDLMDIATHTKVGSYGRRTSPAVRTHGLFVVPKSGTSALLYIERSAGSGSALSKILGLFEEEFEAHLPDLVFRTEQLTESEAWIESASLAKVQVRSHHSDSNSENGTTSSDLGVIEHVLRPKRGAGLLDRGIFVRLRENEVDPGELLGVDPSQEVDHVTVTMKDGAKTKTFEVGRAKTPAFSLVLSGAGQAAPSQSRFRTTALDEAADHFDRLDVVWTEADTAGDWPATIVDQIRIEADDEQDQPDADSEGSPRDAG